MPSWYERQRIGGRMYPIAHQPPAPSRLAAALEAAAKELHDAVNVARPELVWKHAPEAVKAEYRALVLEATQLEVARFNRTSQEIAPCPVPVGPPASGRPFQRKTSRGRTAASRSGHRKT